jgi:hypothetical protein
VAETSALAAPCSREDVAAQVALLGGPNLDDVGERVHIELHGREGSVTYVMASGDVIGPRVVKAASCRELAKSLALVIVMSWRADEPTPAPAPVEAAPVEAAPNQPAPLAPPVAVVDEVIEMPAVVVERAVDRVQPRMSTRHLAVLAGGASDVSGTPALVLGGRVRRGSFSGGLELHLTSPQTLDVGDGGSARITQNAVDALPCFHLAYFAACGVATAGLIGGTGQHLAHAVSVYRASFAVGGRLEASYPVLPRLALRLHVDALQALTSSRFSVDEMVVWTSKPHELWLGGGILAVFP